MASAVILSAEQLASEPGFCADWEAAVLATPGISTLCSGPDWGLSAHHHLHGSEPRQAWVAGLDGHFAALAAGKWFDGNLWVQPWESAWSFASPVAGPDPAQAAHLLTSLCKPLHQKGLPLLLGGLPATGPWREELIKSLATLGRVQEPPLFTAHCLVADLSGGVEDWLARRSVKFRAGLRRSVRLAETEGVVWEALRPTPEVLENTWKRILGVESRCWKQAAGESIFQHESHVRFYRELTARAAAAGRFRLVFGRREGRDLAYGFGVVQGPHYRGMQMSYDASAEGLGLGVAAQFHLLQNLAAEGVVHADFGMDIDYKRRWCDRPLPLSGLVVG